MINTEQKREPIRYWMVNFTLTSGKVIQFYVKARFQQDALEIAKGLKFIGDMPILQQRGNILMQKF